MHQRLRRLGPWVLVGLASLLFMGCTQILNLIEGATGSTNNPTPTPAAGDSIRVVIAELSASMVRTTKFSPAQADVVAKSAQEYVNAAHVSETDFANAIPVAVAGAEAGLSSSSFTESEKMDAVGVITTSFMTSLNGRFADTTRALQGRAISSSVLATLLSRVSKAAVTNLAKTGISKSNLGATASAVVGNMITGLGSSGVNKALVSEALIQITQAAVSSLKDSGLTDSAAVGLAVQAVTRGAVTAVAAVDVAGVTSADYAVMTNQITQGAASALGNVAGATEAEVKSWVASVATGSSEGIVAVSTNLSSTTVASMVQAATSGTTSGVLANKVVDVSGSASAFIGTITAATTKKLAESETLDQVSIQKSVTIGAASAAQTSVAGGMTATQLEAAITLSDKDGTSVALVLTDIQSGVDLGNNAAPLVLAGNDQTNVILGQVVTLTATASDANPGDTLTLLWGVALAPPGSAAKLTGATTLTAMFQPDLAGTYLFSFRATDSKGASSESFVVVRVKTDSVSVYEEKTAQQWLDNAEQKGRTGDFDLARNDLFVILGHFPDSPLVPKASYWLAKVYEALGDRPSYLSQMEKTIAMASADTEFGARARLDYAGFRTWNKRGTFDPKPMLDSVVAAQPNSPVANEAKVKLASLTRNNGLKADGSFDQAAIASCIAQLKALLALSSTELPNEVRFDAQSDLAWSYFDAKDLASASIEFKKLVGLAQTNGPESLTTVNQMRFNAVQNYWWFAKYADDSQYLPAAQSGMTTLSADASQDADLRLQAARTIMEYLIWEKPETASETKASLLEAAITLGLAVIEGTTSVNDSKTKAQRTWVYTRLGNANDDLRGHTKDAELAGAYTTAALAAYLAAQETGWGHWYGYRPAGEAMVNAAGQHHWNKGEVDTHNDTALALVGKVLAELPADVDQWPKAYAQFRQGEILRDIGKDEQKQNGKDYLNTYNKAIVAFSRVSKSLFPTVDSNEWFFREAVRNLGEIYMNMRQFVAARSYFNQVLGDNTVTPESKVWSQLSLANSYGEEFMQFVQEGNLTQAQLLWDNKALGAFDQVSTYKNKDGSLINRGEPWAHALLQKGRYLRDAANTWRYQQGAASTVWIPLYQKAAKVFEQVNAATFGNLPSDGWELKDGIRDLADCQFKLGIFDDGRKALNDLLGLMDQTPPKAPNGGRWEVLKQLAGSYREEADSITQGMNDAERLALQGRRVELNELSLAETGKMYTSWADQTAPTQDATNSTAWALTDAGWAILDAANTLGWDGSNATDGQQGYSADDWIKLDAYQTQLTELLALVTTTPALQNANGGASIARLHRILGHWYHNTAWRLAKGTGWKARVVLLDKAWVFYELGANNSAAEPDDVGACLASEVEIKSSYARQAYDPKAALDNNLAARVQAFEDAIDLALLVMVNPRVSINEVAGACVTVGQLYRDLHSSHALKREYLGGVGVTGMDKPGEWQTSILFWVRAIAEKSDNFATISNGWAIEEAKNLMKYAQSSGTVNVQVQ